MQDVLVLLIRVTKHIPNKEDLAMTEKSQQTNLSRRLEAFHIPKRLSARIVAEVTKWTEKSGTEWTVKRLKALKTDYIRIISGNSRSSLWVDYRGDYPRGCFGDLFRLGIGTPKQNIRVINALMIYSSYVSRQATEAQLSKFYNSVSSREIEQTVVDSVFGDMLPLVEKLEVRPKRVRKIDSYIPSNSKRCPTCEGKTVPDSEWLETIDVLWKTSLGRLSYQRYESVREAVRPLENLVLRNIRKFPAYLHQEGDTVKWLGFAGKIGHIQEPGFKLRAVANPFRVYQLALSRLGDQLYELIRSLPWDCTHDQDSGVKWAEERLRSGLTMYAVDLSDATNTFPLSLQLELLKKLKGVHDQDINLFRDLSKASWLSPTHGIVSWKKGQPLGLYPSFAAFALTHGLLVASLERKLQLPIGENFRVLGDDIVISNASLYNEYRKVLKMLEVPVSEDKTLVSNRVTEFGGRVILPGTIIAPAKWRLSSDRNFIDMVRNVGPRYVKYLPTRQRRVVEKLMVLPEPVGLNMNPLGVSALERWELEQTLYYLYQSQLELPQGSKDTWTQSLMQSKTVQSTLFKKISLNKFLHSEVFMSSRDERRTTSVLSRICKSTGAPFVPSTQFTCSNESNWIDILEKSETILKELGYTKPVQSGDPRGTTLLELWEKRLKSVNK